MFTLALTTALALAGFVHAAPAATTVASPPPVPIPSNPVGISTGLKAQPGNVDKMKKLFLDPNGNLLTGEALRELAVFDFNNQTPAPGANGGSILLATVDNFPFLQGQGISGAISFIEPCGLNIPHFHPRASEILTVIAGQLEAGMVMENGFNTEIRTSLGTFQGTVFPMGSLHYQYNPTCKNATFVAGLGSDDPGRSDIATNFWMLETDVIDAALGFPETIGGSNIDQWRSHLPVNLANGIDTCLKACGLPGGPTSAAPSATARASASAPARVSTSAPAASRSA